MAFQVNMNPLVQSSQNVGGAIAGAGGAFADALQRQDQQQQQGDIQAMMTQALSGDPKALEQLYVMNPEAAQIVAQKLSGDLQSQQAESDRLTSQMALDTADAVERLHLAPDSEKEAIFQAMIDDPRYDIDDEDRPFFMDAGARKALIGQVKGEDYAENLFGESESDKVLPAEAVAFNDLIKDFTPEQKKLARQVKAGIKGRAISNAELSAIQSGEIDDYGKWKVKQKQAEKFAEMTGASRARTIDKSIEKLAKIDLGLSNIDSAIVAVRDKGANTGFIDKMFPSIKAASVELDNIQGKMALDVVGAVTFGALSQGELDLAKSVALPTGLDGPELIKYLQDKKVAQQKLRDYYNEQIQFLDQGGTVAGFLREKERNNTEKSAVNQDQQALQWAKDNPNDPRSVQILNKLGAGK